MLEFFNVLWKGEGLRCLAIKTGGTFRHQFFETNEQAEAYFATVKDGPNDVYFAPAIFSDKRRKQDCVKSICSFWLDIDCGPNKDYATRQEGLDRLYSFLPLAGLPKPVVVCSGNGLHVYWPLSNPLSPDEWLTRAQRLKALCVMHGLKADPSRTCDSASVLRPAGSLNHKSNPPMPVGILSAGEVSDPACLLNAPSDNVGAKASGGLMAPEYPDVQLQDVAKRCGFIMDVLKKKGAVDEPLWRAFLSIAFRCDQGANLIHDFSKGDPRYSFKETQAKAEGTKGPYTCEQIQSLCPDFCKDCPFKGRASSPISMARIKDYAEPPTDEIKSDPVARQGQVGDFEITTEGVRKIVHDGDHIRRVYVTAIPIWVKRVSERAKNEDGRNESAVHLYWQALNGQYRDGMLDQTDLYEKRSFIKWLAENNIRACVGKEVSPLQDYITAAIVEHIRANNIDTFYDSNGWAEGGFVVGSRMVTEQGERQVTVKTSSAICKMGKCGSRDKWVSATAVLANPDYYTHAFAVLCGFGSILVDLADLQSAVVSLVGESGYGKTLAGSMALSIYGDPAVMTQAATATQNAIGMQLAAHKNLPYMLDEVSGMPSYKLADFLYDAANGRQKEVLSKDRKLQQGAGWALVPFITSNHSVLEMSVADIQEAHRKRVLEIPFDNKITKDDAATLAVALQDNYGTVGDEYIRKILALRPQIKSLVAKELKTPLLKDIPSVYRFGAWTIACAAVGGKIAHEMGLIQFSPAEVISKVVKVFLASIVSSVSEAETARRALVAFLYNNVGCINFLSSAPNAIDTTNPRMIYARYDNERKFYYMAKDQFKGIIREAGLSFRNLSSWIKRRGILVENQRLASNMPRIECFAIPEEVLGVKSEELQGGVHE